MADAARTLTQKYDSAAPKWRDKMRALGYYDGYLGFLSAPGLRPTRDAHVLDVGCGTGAMAEAWVAVNGAPERMTLLDPSEVMVRQAGQTLAQRQVTAQLRIGMLGDALPKADEVLAAHVIEHCRDPAEALTSLKALLKPRGVLRLVVSKPHWCNAIIWLQWQHQTFTRPQMDALFEDTGLKLLSDYRFPSGPPSRTSHGYVLQAR